jgi:hypothetical protein
MLIVILWLYVASTHVLVIQNSEKAIFIIDVITKMVHLVQNHSVHYGVLFGIIPLNVRHLFYGFSFVLLDV